MSNGPPNIKHPVLLLSGSMTSVVTSTGKVAEAGSTSGATPPPAEPPPALLKG